MPTVKFWKRKVLLAKIESAYGADPTLTGAANAILAINVSLRPMEGEDVSRNLELPFRGQSATIPTGLRQVLQFDTEIAGSGAAGTAPAWGPLARACGMAQIIVAATSVTYSPISDSYESIYIKLYVDGILHTAKGNRGTCQLVLNAQGIPVMRWTFTGLWVTPTDSANPAPTLTAFQKPKIASTANTPNFTINAVPLVLRSWSFDLANDVQARLLVNREEILIVDSEETLSVVVEAVPLATFNPFALAEAQTLVAAQLTHGTVAGNIFGVQLGGAQIKRPAGLGSNQNILEWPLVLGAKQTGGNDQFQITLT